MKTLRLFYLAARDGFITHAYLSAVGGFDANTQVATSSMPLSDAWYNYPSSTTFAAAGPAQALFC